LENQTIILLKSFNEQREIGIPINFRYHWRYKVVIGDGNNEPIFQSGDINGQISSNMAEPSSSNFMNNIEEFNNLLNINVNNNIFIYIEIEIFDNPPNFSMKNLIIQINCY